MATKTRKGPIFDPGLCRCCGAIKKCRILNYEYEYLGHKEIYSEMFVDSFGLLLSNLDGDEKGRLICATCVVRLRDALAFRLQVLRCEERLLSSTVHVHGDGNNTFKTEIKVEEVEDVDDVPLEEVCDVPLEEVCHVPAEKTNNVPAQDVSTEANHVLERQADDVVADDDRSMDDCVDHLESVTSLPLPSIEPSISYKDDDNGDTSDTLSIKSEMEPKPKKSKQKKILTKRRSRRSNIDKAAKKKTTGLKKKRRTRNSDIELHFQGPANKSEVESEFKAFTNTVTVVENSYVCPFYTSYSDYYCIYCREIYTDPDKLREHTLTHDPTTFKNCIADKKILLVDIVRIDCRLCLTKINDIDTLKSHLTNCHNKKFYEMSNDFLKFRLTTKNLTCTECGSTFSFFHALKKHMAEHFGACICDVCGAHYFEERMLILHQKSHKRIEESFSCQDCGKIFKSKHSRYLHETKTHKKEPAYPCYKCEAVLFSYSLRYRHMIDVHGEKRMFPCEHCDRAYDSRKSLREHNRRYHLKILKHQCDLCDKRFYLPSRLKEHMATHTGERNFRCEFCGKSYPRLRGLKVHMQSHSSEKKYRCVICNSTFTQNVNLKNHMKRLHQSSDMEEGYHEGT